jgi:hypothetical protein
MRLLMVLGLAGLFLAFAGDARAAQFCAHYRGGGENCGFHTFEQCLAAISGVGGYCARNPRWGYGDRRRDGRY